MAGSGGGSLSRGAGVGGARGDVALLEWEEGDRYSFEDSDRFEEDSLCSWSSEPESVCNNWRGWKRPTNGNPATGYYASNTNNKPNESGIVVPALSELTAKCVASHIPFELVEHVYPPVPEQLQLRIAFWSFPDNEEDIRLYSCLANGSADEFARGESLHRNRMVKDPLQIGFHLSATVQQSPRGVHNVAVTFDRRRISSCNCTCTSTAYWCSHVVAVCLTRIHWPESVTLRAPVSESLSRLHREQLQKFAQYLISELPQQILPTAQRLLDELLGSQPSAINSVCGAPDPTAGASANDQTSWYLDEKTLHNNINKILIKFCVPAPIVFSDVNYLSTVAPPAAAEWSSLLRPLRGREPEGMWNLLSIVREMFKRNDRNAVPLLEIITNECMACDQILLWWFNTKVALLSGNSGYGSSSGGKHNVNSNSHASQHACSSLCDEVVVLWRLAALNPGLAPHERDILHDQFRTWHMKILDKVAKCRSSGGVPSASGGKAGGVGAHSHGTTTSAALKMDLDVFTGFRPAIEACYLDWDDYPVAGVTYTRDANPMYHCPFTCFRHGASADASQSTQAQINTSKAVLNCETPSHTFGGGGMHRRHHHYHSCHMPRICRYEYVNVLTLDPAAATEYARLPPAGQPRLPPAPGNARSSVSSEGFCENVDDLLHDHNRDSDSQEGGASDSSDGASSSSSSSSSVGGEIRLHEAHFEPPELPVQPPLLSKDAGSDSSSNSDSPQDEYNLYYYDSKDLSVDSSADTSSRVYDQDYKSAATLENGPQTLGQSDPWDVLFARAEGLHAHGHNREACILAVRLAEELLAHPPDLMIDIPAAPRRKGKRQPVNPACHQLSCLASATLAKGAFLCNVLAEELDHAHLAFRVGMFGLEMARPPASTKPLEVKLANQEADLVGLLKRIPLGHRELETLREKAERLKDGTLRSRGDALLPITLASFVFDALCMPSVIGRDRAKVLTTRLPTDESLGFEAAVAALGLKANVSEAEHPLLCEGTRRQRGDLAMALLTFYKDDCWKVARIMDRLLDREVHQLLRAPVVGAYYSANPPLRSRFSNMRLRDEPPAECVMSQIPPYCTIGDAAAVAQTVPPDMGCCSRPPLPTTPETSSSALLSTGMPPMQLPSTAQPPPATARISKEPRYKGKRAYPSLPNQPSEAGAHFTFELAKTVLTKAGGSSSTSLFTQPSASQHSHGPHRALHMCAFQLGLYALGLHNCVSPNWLSRTYSSHVSWITGQAMEIGAAAISFLIDTWEGHLTPPEAASIADRASRGCDPNMVRAAAELALSCLPHAAALNPNEITRAILQCKEQSDDMLEHACLTVEGAAKGGGVYPEVLFQVARYWHELYIRDAPSDPLSMAAMTEEPSPPPHGSFIALIEAPPGGGELGPGSTCNLPVVVTAPPALFPPPPPPTVTTLASVPIPYTVGHYNWVHPYGGAMHPHAMTAAPPPPPHHHMQVYQFHQYSPPTAPPPPPPGAAQQYSAAGLQPPPGPAQGPPAPPAYLQAPPPQPHPAAAYPVPQGPPLLAPPYQSQAGQQQPPPPTGPIQYYTTAVTIAQPSGVRPIAAQGPYKAAGLYSVTLPPPQVGAVSAAGPSIGGGGGRGARVAPHGHHSGPQPVSHAQLRYLLAAYRVGMLAMETLARRVHDDRPQAKYARNPPYGDDVKWLMNISKQLGVQYVHHFCVSAVNSLVSPFLLHDVALEVMAWAARPGPPVQQHLRTAVQPLVQKCQQMYIQCMHQKLYHLTAADHEEFVATVVSAKAAFHLTPDGQAQFKEWLQSIKRSKSCKKELWMQINNAIQTNTK